MGSLASSLSACGSTSRTASICSIVPFGLPGVLQMMVVPRMPGDAARQAAVRAHEAHRLGQSGASRSITARVRFRRLVAWSEPRAAGRDDQPGEAVAHLAQRPRDDVGAVLSHAMLDDLESVGDQMGGQPAPARVVAEAVEHAIADRQHLGEQRRLVAGDHVARHS